jgi:hypothetical protein
MNLKFLASLHCLIIASFVLMLPAMAQAQNRQKTCFIGISPAVTVEPFYQHGEFDINILPLVYQKPISKRVDIRLSSILNYGARKSSDQLSHFGVQIAMPVFLKSKDPAKPSHGLYLAPGTGLTRNILERHNNIGIWLEPGYNLLINDKWAFSFGVQIGATHFSYDNGSSKWRNHFGIKVIFGRWI